jgi:dipeptidase E
MKKMFLASFNLDGLECILPKPLKDLNVAFIPTAANTYQDRWFVEKDREKLKSMGLSLKEVDIDGKTQQEVEKLLEDIQIIHITGGNTFYLLEKIRESGFDKVLPKMLDAGVVFVGTSAGSIIVGPDIEPVGLIDDPQDAPNLKSTKGLGLVDFVILPHFDNQKYTEKYKEIMAKYNSDFNLLPLNDNQAALVDGNSYKVIDLI